MKIKILFWSLIITIAFFSVSSDSDFDEDIEDVEYINGVKGD